MLLAMSREKHEPILQMGRGAPLLQHTVRKWQNEDVNPDLAGISTVESSFVAHCGFLSVHEGQGHDCKSMTVKQQPTQPWEFTTSCNLAFLELVVLTCPMEWAGVPWPLAAGGADAEGGGR